MSKGWLSAYIPSLIYVQDELSINLQRIVLLLSSMVLHEVENKLCL